MHVYVQTVERPVIVLSTMIVYQIQVTRTPFEYALSILVFSVNGNWVP